MPSAAPIPQRGRRLRKAHPALMPPPPPLSPPPARSLRSRPAHNSLPARWPPLTPRRRSVPSAWRRCKHAWQTVQVRWMPMRWRRNCWAARKKVGGAQRMTVDDPQSAEFDDLLLNLDRQSALYDRLYDLSERERAAIAGADLIQLAALVAEKEQIVAEAQRLERRRDAMCRQWARQRGMDGAPTLNDVRGWAASPAVRARLDAAAVSLSRRVSR